MALAMADAVVAGAAGTIRGRTAAAISAAMSHGQRDRAKRAPPTVKVNATASARAMHGAMTVADAVAIRAGAAASRAARVQAVDAVMVAPATAAPAARRAASRE